jgi:hypothetical protein
MQSVLDTLSAAAKVLARVRSEGGFQRTMDLTSRSREVQSILGLTEMELRNGDASRIAKLGAMFHTDLALLPKDPLLPYRIPLLQLQTAKASRSETLLVRDGIIYGSSKMTHWNHARRILDLLHPNPSRDATVRRWSIATSSILQQLLLLGPANKHLQWAQEVFPEDADIQFLLGSLHECLAAPRAQNVVLPPDFRSDIGPEKVELRTARQHFQQAQRINSRLTNAHLHLGRVEGLLGSHRESIAELRQAERAATDPQDQYYLSLFLGSGLEATGDFDGAKQQYQRAAQLYPAAQLPWLALSQLARRRGDLREAIAALERGLTLLETNDPWWEYLIAHVRNADSLLTEIRAEIGKLPR